MTPTKTLHLVIDSSIYLQDPSLNRLSLRSVSKYCEIGMVALYIPYVVEMEYLSHVTAEVRRIDNEILASVTKLHRFIDKESAVGLEFTRTFQSDEIKNVIAKVEKKWNTFKARSKATIVGISPSHGQRVMESYFSGSPPFERAKSRNDIPDAYIHAVIVDLISEEGSVHFVSSDERLREHCAKQTGLAVYKHLDEFLSSQDMQRMIISVSAPDRMQRMSELLRFFEDAIKYQSGASLMISVLGSDTIRADLIEGHMLEPEMSLPMPSNIELDYGKVVVYTDEDCSVYFSGQFTLRLSYKMQRQEIVKLDKDRVAAFSNFEEIDDFYYVEEDIQRQIRGLLGVHIPLGRIDQVKVQDIGLSVEEVY
jgi:hypothetical protein